MSLKKKIALLCLFACSMGWLSMRLSFTISDDMIYTTHPELLDKCLEEGETEPDYTLNPYYLRLDLDGDGGMDYVTFIANNSGQFHLYPVIEEGERLEPAVGRSLLACFSDGRKVVYHGADDQKSDAPGSLQEKGAGGGERPHAATKNDGPDPKQSEQVSADEDSSHDESVVHPWVVEDRVLTGKESSERNTVAIMFSWYPLSRREVLEEIDYWVVPLGSGEVLGEGIVNGFEDVTLGFWDGKQFRWLTLSGANGFPPTKKKERKKKEELSRR